MPNPFNVHPKNYGQGAFWHVCRKCGNNHGLIRKYHVSNAPCGPGQGAGGASHEPARCLCAAGAALHV